MLLQRMIISLLLLTVWTHAVGEATSASEGKLLLHWNFDEARPGTVGDLSGNGLDGSVGATWVASPSGKAVMMDGASQSTVSVQIPEGKRFGSGSWTFTAMLKPARFSIDERQNQRRIFAFGDYPAAYLVIDIGGDGRLMCHFCYQDTSGKIVSVGGSSQMSLVEKRWAHVALVCDRDQRWIKFYINGYSPGTTEIPANFAGDFTLGGQLTIGSSWHNYWGLVDEVKIYRTAFSSDAVEAEFERLRDSFQVVESEEAIAAKRRARLAQTFVQVNAASARGNFGEVRGLCQPVVDSTDTPPHFRSYAHLRIAQSYLAEDDRDAARSTYEAIAANESYPAVHRYESRQSSRELGRLLQGLAARDPAESRTAVPAVSSFAAEVFVSPQGDDAQAGSEQQPFATLARARDEVRALKRSGVAGPIAVTVLPGQYSVRSTLTLTADDSGTEASPVVYRARQKGTAVFSGGTRISGFQPVADEKVLQRLSADARGKVWQCDLKALGIDDYGELKVRGFAQPPSPPTFELYVDQVPMTLARWPNKGFVGIRKLVSPGSRQNGEPSVFEYDSARHERWLEASDAWLFGYFHFLWADATIKIGKIEPVSRTLATAEPYHYGGRGMSTVQGIQYYAFNLLEEIDMPGEWYLDRETGVLYLYPPSAIQQCQVEVSLLSTPFVALDKVSHLRLEGLVFDLARHHGVVATDCRQCSLIGCTVRRLAGNGVMIHGGEQNSLIGCDIHTIGRRATEIIGGDRETLTPGGHLVENCQLYDFGRIDRTYTPAIQLEGVGHRVAHNLMYQGPSSAMRIEGNDHVIEFNEVHSMVQESDDQGAMELFRNPTYRGVVFRHNFFHHVGKTGTEAAVHGQAAIRFDDAISGMLVYGNVFYHSANGNFGAIQMNSGRDNLMDNNLFIDCKQGISGGWYPGNNVWKMLRDGQQPQGFYQNELYLTRYPQLVSMLDEPAVNHAWRNVFFRCGSVATRTSHLDLFENGVFEDRDPGFVDAAKGDFRLHDDAILFQTVGFKPIPLDEIGLYDAASRATWPVD